jgi:hypothetical protein
MPIWALVHLYIDFQMTIVSTANGITAPDNSLAIVAELVGDQSNEIQMMIGVNSVKDSDAVFFEFLGDNQYRALVNPATGKPVTRLASLRFAGITVAEDIGKFKASKLNLFLTTYQGNNIMVTSGLTTLWSQSLIISLMGMFNTYGLSSAFNLDTWKGDAEMRPAFAAIRVGKLKMTDQDMYDQIREIRSDKDDAKLEAVMRDSIEILNAANGFSESYANESSDVIETDVSETESTDDEGNNTTDY